MSIENLNLTAKELFKTDIKILNDQKNKQELEKIQLMENNKRLLNESGVVSLFTQLRDTGSLRLDRLNPAEITWGDKNKTISIGFDRWNNGFEEDSDSYMEGKYEITASVYENDKIGILKSRQIKSSSFRFGYFNQDYYIPIENGNLAEVVAKEISSLKSR